MQNILRDYNPDVENSSAMEEGEERMGENSWLKEVENTTTKCNPQTWW